MVWRRIVWCCHTMPNHTIGKLEQRVIQFLGKKSGCLIKWVADALHADYKSTHTAVKSLVKKGYVETAKPVETSKGNVEKTYMLSEKGVCYALANGLVSFRQLSPAYMPLELVQTVKSLEKLVDPQMLERFLKKGFRLYLSLLENGSKPADAVNYMVGAILGWLLTIGHVQPVETQATPDNVKKLLALWREWQRS